MKAITREWLDRAGDDLIEPGLLKRSYTIAVAEKLPIEKPIEYG
jgi:hypothetical protein